MPLLKIHSENYISQSLQKLSAKKSSIFELQSYFSKKYCRENQEKKINYSSVTWVTSKTIGHGPPLSPQNGKCKKLRGKPARDLAIQAYMKIKSNYLRPESKDHEIE